jgi:hypothetical protein
MLKLFAALFLAFVIGAAAALPSVDGSIAEGEYANTLTHEESGTVLHWTVEDDMVYFGFTMEARGWVGIGWGDEIVNRKAGFDVLIFTMDGDMPVALDMFQASARGEPVLDTAEGGSNSLVEFAASRDGDLWTVEFVRPLATGEETDVDIVPGDEMVFMLGHATVMDPTRAHPRSTQGGAYYIDPFVF